MTAAAAIQPAAVPVTRGLGKPHLRLVEDLQDGHKPKPKSFRLPKREIRQKFYANVCTLITYAEASRQRLVFFTLTSRARGGEERVLADLKRCWARLQDRAVFRSLPASLWVFGDHGRPAIHVLAVLPDDVTINMLRSTWNAGFTHGKTSDGNAEALSDYLAAQFRQYRRTFLRGQRSFGFRGPPSSCLDSRAPIQPQLSLVPSPQQQPQGAPLRAEAGGLAESAVGAMQDLQARPSCRLDGSERALPVSGGAGSMHAPTADKDSPPCVSEQGLRLVPDVGGAAGQRLGQQHGQRLGQQQGQQHGQQQADQVGGGNNMIENTLPPPFAGPQPTTWEDVQIGMAAVRSIIRRDPGEALSIFEIAQQANIKLQLAHEAVMRLLYAGHLRRRGQGPKRSAFSYWATKTCPATPAVLVPVRLRFFFTPPFFGSP